MKHGNPFNYKTQRKEYQAWHFQHVTKQLDSSTRYRKNERKRELRFRFSARRTRLQQIGEMGFGFLRSNPCFIVETPAGRYRETLIEPLPRW